MATAYSYPQQTNRSTPVDNSLSDQITELRRIAAYSKDDFLGSNWFDDVKQFYSLDDPISQTPSWRPRVAIPQLQMFMLAETSELTDNDPRIYITSPDGDRDKEREKALEGMWKQEHYSYHLMRAQLWANMGGTGIAAFGIDPYAYGGRGTVWMEAIDPSRFFPDPAALGEEDWLYCVWERPMYWDQVVMRWPDQGYRVPQRPASSTPTTQQSAVMRMPVGPLQETEGIPQSRYASSGLVTPRFCFTLDTTVERVKQIAGSSAGKAIDIAPSKFKLRWPNGRLSIDCENVILKDGDNPTPHRKFPFVAFWGMPKLEGFWAPPPVRYTQTLQDISERLSTQYFENCVRLNNGTLLLPDTMGQDPESVAFLPGGVIVYSPLGGEPKILTPPPFPPQFVESIRFFLDQQAQLQGYTEPRTGQPGAGNISVDLYEAALDKASRLTRLRFRLMAISVQKSAEMIFYFAARYFRNRIQFPNYGEEFSMAPWNPITDDGSLWNAYVDPGSIEPMSAMNLRKTALALKQAGLYDTQSTLEALGVPNAKEIAKKTEQETALQALANIKQGSKGKRG